MNIVTKPKSVLIESIAVELAATWWEIGRSQGMTSKHKTAKAYAKANLEKFIPKAVETCLDMLGPKSQLPDVAKRDVYDALMERLNDPELLKYRPNLDMKKVQEYERKYDLNKPGIQLMVPENSKAGINAKPKTVLHDQRKSNGKSN